MTVSVRMARVVWIGGVAALALVACGTSSPSSDAGDAHDLDDVPQDTGGDGQDATMLRDDAGSETLPDAWPDVATDGGGSDTSPDGGADAEGGAAVCGNGVVDPGEGCDLPNGALCGGCKLTECGYCVNDTVCATLTGLARDNCGRLMNCLAYGQFTCVVGSCPQPGLGGGSIRSCYCGGASCTADGPCAAEFQAVADSQDPAEVLRQLGDASTVLGRIDKQAARAACDFFCGRRCGGWLYINEIDYDQVGADSAEFVEIQNAGGRSVDLAGYSLVFKFSSPSEMPVALSGTLPANGYLVVGSAGVSVPSGAVKVALPQAADYIPNERTFEVALVRGSVVFDVFTFAGFYGHFDRPEPPSGVPVTTTIQVQDTDTTSGSVCRFPDGRYTLNDALDWAFCPRATPGAPN